MLMCDMFDKNCEEVNNKTVGTDKWWTNYISIVEQEWCSCITINYGKRRLFPDIT